jgi:hypothetical protein
MAAIRRGKVWLVDLGMAAKGGEQDRVLVRLVRTASAGRELHPGAGPQANGRVTASVGAEDGEM